MAPHPLHHLFGPQHHPLAHLPGPLLPALRNVPRTLGRSAAEPEIETVPWHYPDWAGDDHKHDCATLRPRLGTGNGSFRLGSVVD
jgi:hypothetical protein